MKQGSKRLYALLPLLAAAALAVLVGVDYQNTKKAARQVTAQYSWLGWDAFDTITNVIGNAQSEEEWNSQMQAFHEDLLEYHRLYDIYNTYEGVVNLANVNEMAGKGPMQVDERIIALLQEAKAMYAQTNGKTNVAAGAVLSLWHDARTAGLENAQNAALPSEQALQQAAGHCNIEDLVIDEAAGTVELKDPAMRLDVGSIGKGYAVEQCARAAEQRGLASASISVGGNIRTIGLRADGTEWSLGVEDPRDQNSQTALYALSLPGGQSLVTSGDYQRYYTVNGEKYHHLIDLQTLYPARYWNSVTVIAPDSGLADGLSTGLFCMDYEQGRALAESLPGVEVCWVRIEDGKVKAQFTEGFKEKLQ